MGISSSSTKQTQSYTPSSQQLGAANALTDAYNTAKPLTAQVTGQLGSLIPGLTSTATAANAAANDAAGYYSDVLGGKYLSPSTNPYLASVLAQNDAAISDQVNGQFSAAGRYGSGANTYALGKAIGEANNSALLSNYNAERAQQASAASGAQGLSASSLASLLGLGTTVANLPLQQAAQYSSGIGSLGIGGTTTSTSQSNPGLGSILGSALQIGSLFAGGGGLGSLFGGGGSAASAATGGINNLGSYMTANPFSSSLLR